LCPYLRGLTVTSPAGDVIQLAAGHVGATVAALAFSLRSAFIDGLAHTADWVPLVESSMNDLVFAAIAVVFLWAFPNGWNAGCCCGCFTGFARWLT